MAIYELHNEEELESQPAPVAEEAKDALPSEKTAQPIIKVRKPGMRKSKPFTPIIMCFIILLLGVISLDAQVNGSVSLGTYYTDNAFALSDFDINRFESNDPALSFVSHTDDVVLQSSISLAYDMHYRWWLISPYLTLKPAQNILNTDKHRLDTTAGVEFSRRLGSLNLSYTYSPYNYLRQYTDTDGTGRLEDFTYSRNTYRAIGKLKPSVKSTLTVDYRYEEYYYDKYFTEYDGTANTIGLAWEQSFPIFYVNAGYAYRALDAKPLLNDDEAMGEDSSYESNIYTAGLTIKKMPLSDKNPTFVWRPALDFSYEDRYFQGSDTWHAGRHDTITGLSAALQFYPVTNWNLNLDYSNVFRNVDASDLSVQKYKEYGENRFGVSAHYQF